MATISKTSTFRHQNFLRECSVGLCLWLSLGPRLLRQNTFAFGSREGCRGDCAVSPRGQGGCGCAGHFGPWPRRRIWGEPHEAWDLCEEVNEDVDSLSFFFCDHDYIASFPTVRLKEQILRSDFSLSKGSYTVMVWEGHHNPKTVPELPEFSL